MSALPLLEVQKIMLLIWFISRRVMEIHECTTIDGGAGLVKQVEKLTRKYGYYA
jgi:hypothetical protein